VNPREYLAQLTGLGDWPAGRDVSSAGHPGDQQPGTTGRGICAIVGQ
jgi:hypothetical protein